MKRLILVLVLVFAFSSNLWAYGLGVSSYPMMPEKKVITTEAIGIVSKNGGVGVQVRYTQKLSSELSADAGMGISGGARTSRIFVGADYEFFPDYQNQPRVSLKGMFENAKEFNGRNNIMTFAPTVSKGFNMWGEEIYPYFSLPYGLGLNSKTKTYQTTVNATLGAIGKLSLEGYENLTASLEATINLKESWSGLFVGLSYPLN